METKTFEINKRYTLTKVYDTLGLEPEIIQYNQFFESNIRHCNEIIHPLLDNMDGPYSCQVVLIGEDNRCIGAYYYAEFTQILVEKSRSRIIEDLAFMIKPKTIVLLTAHRESIFVGKDRKIGKIRIEDYAKKLEKKLATYGVKEVTYLPCNVGYAGIRKK